MGSGVGVCGVGLGVSWGCFGGVGGYGGEKSGVGLGL